MAADKVYTIVINAKGEPALKLMKDINKEGEKFVEGQTKVHKAQKKTNKGANDYVKKNKGVGDLTNNATHAFSKMAQQMTGIVPVYATVAANVFAITAAFGALERAADFQILIDSADSLAVQTGRSLTSLAENMKEITGSAISMKEALVQASIAASAGFDNSTIEQLAQVARNASVALGREMTDSLNRVFKGAIKAEPELLDELGIILRLETAANKYATALGKTAKELTTFEKQQAVVNEVLEQGEKKFGRLSNVDPNPFTQLAAAFSDITTQLVNLVNIPLSGFIGFFTENIASLTAAILLLATSVAKQALPALAGMAVTGINAATKMGNAFKVLSDKTKAWSDNIQKAKASAESLSKSAISEANITEGSKPFDIIMNKNAAAVDKVDAALRSVRGQLGAVTRAAGKAGVISPNMLAQREALEATRDGLISVKNELKNTTKATKVANVAMRGLAGGMTLVASTASIATLGVAGFATSMGVAAAAVASTSGLISKAETALLHFWEAGEGQNKFVKVFSKIGSVVGSFGAGLFSLVPVIAGVTIAWQILSSTYVKLKKIFGFEDIAKLSEKLEEQTVAVNKSAAAAENYAKNLERLPRTLENINDQLTLQSNVLGGLHEQLKKVNSAIDIDGGFGWWDGFLDIFNAGQLDSYRENIDKIVKQIERLGFSTSVSKDIKEMSESWIEGGGTAEGFGKKLEGVLEKLHRFARGAKEANQATIENVEALNKATNKLFGSLPSLGGVDQTLVSLSSLANRLDGKEFETVADTLRGMSSLTIGTLGLQDLSKELKNVDEEGRFVEGQLKAISAVIAVMKEDGKFTLEEQGTIQKLQAIGDQLKLNLQISKDSLGKKLEKPLSDAQERFEEMSNAARQLKEDLSLLSLDKLNAQNTNVDVINILKKETDLKVKTITIQTNSALKGISIIKAADNKLNGERKDHLEELAGISDKKSERALDLASKLGVVEGRLATNASEQKKLQLSLDKTRGKSAELVKKLYLSTEKEIAKVTKLQDKGIVGLEDKYESLDNTIRTSAKTLATITGKTEQWAEGIIASRIAQEGLNKFYAQAGIMSTQALAQAIEAKDLNTSSISEQIQLNRDLNGLLQERLDTEYQITQNRLNNDLASVSGQITQNEAKLETASPTDATAINKTLDDLRDRYANINALIGAGIIENNILMQQTAENKINSLTRELKLQSVINAANLKGNRAQIEAIKLKRKEESLGGLDPKDIKLIINLQKKLNKEARKAELAKSMESAAEAMNQFAAAVQKINFEGKENSLFNGLLLLQEIGDSIDGPLGKLSKGFAQAGQAAAQYSAKMAELDEAQIALDSTWEENPVAQQAIDTEKSAAAMSALGNAAGALAGSFEEGSDAAKTFMLIQQAAAIASAAKAVADAGNGDPYSGIARAAAMLSLLTGVLGAAGIAFGGSSSSGAGSEEAYSDRMGSDALRDRDLQSNYMVDSLDDLVAIDTQLFSATRDLQITMKNLGETFERIGALVFASISGEKVTDYENLGTDTFQNNEALINTITGITNALTLGLDEMLGGVVGKVLGGIFGSTKVTNSVIDTGIKLSASLTSTSEGLEALFDTLRQSSVVLTQTESSGMFGFSSSSSSSINEDVAGTLDDDLVEAMNKALDQTLTVVNGLINTFGSAVGGIDMSKIFSNLQFDVFGDDFISLFELSAEEAGEAIGLYFSALSSDILGEVLPFLSDYQKAGEELGETMVRISADTIKLSNSLSTVGLTLEDIIGSLTFNSGGVAGSVFDNLYQSTVDTLNSELSVAQSNLATQLSAYKTIQDPNEPDTSTAFLRVYDNPALIESLGEEIASIQEQITDAAFDILNSSTYVSKIDTASAQAAEAFKLEVVAAWEDALLKNFKDMDEFQEIFEMFSRAIFSETELFNISVGNATSNIENGFTELVNSVDDFTANDLETLLAENGGDFGEALRSFYDDAIDSSLFNADILAGNEIGTDGADIFATTVKLGASITMLDELLQGLAEEIEDLNKQYVQQIVLFGQLEKEAALLALAFDFADAIKEAEETGSDLALVEQAYGLERLAIVKDAFEQINDEIEDAISNIVDSILTISEASETFDSLAFATIKINKLVDRLKKGTNSLNLDSLIGDTSGFEEFITNFQDVIDSLSTEGPGSVSEEISLVGELNDAIIDRYAIELELLETQRDAYKDLSTEIQGYLEDILLSDASPLTNQERLDEAESQFLSNAADIFSSDEEVAADAAADILSSADSLLEAASGFYSIGPEYVKVFDLVTSVLSGIDADLLVKKDETVLAIEDLNATTISQLGVLDSILLELQYQNETTLENDIATIITEGMLDVKDGIIDKLTSIDDGSWTDIIRILDAIAVASVPSYESVATSSALYDIEGNTGEFSTTGLAIGTPRVPYDMNATIHQGETVVPESFAQGIRNGSLTLGEVKDNADVVAAIHELTLVLADSQEDIANIASQNVKASMDISQSMAGNRTVSTRGVV